MLIMGLTANNAKGQLKGLVQKSQIYIYNENKSCLSSVVSNYELAKYSNLAIQKANKTAFHLSNYLTFNKIFGSVRDQMLQQTRTRIFEYAFKSKFPASQESISLIYPRARMYPILEQDIWTTYKGKNNINHIFSSLIWISGFITVLSIWPFFKTHPSNQRFVPERFTMRKRSIFSQLERRARNSWDISFSLNTKTKDHFIFFNLLPITKNKICLSLFTIISTVSKSNISQTDKNISIINKKDLSNDKYIETSKKVLYNYSLKNCSKQIKSQFLHKFYYSDPFLNQNNFSFIKLIIPFSRNFTQVSLRIAKAILSLIGTLTLHFKHFIIEKNNSFIQYIQTRFFYSLQSIFHILNKFYVNYNFSVQNKLLFWENQLQKRIYFNNRFTEACFSPGQIKEVNFKIDFLKIKIVKKSIQLKELFEPFVYTLKYKIFIYLTKMKFIFSSIKKYIILKNVDLKWFAISLESTLNRIQRQIVKDKVFLISYSSNNKNQKSNLALGMEIKNRNQLIYPRYYKIISSINQINKIIYKNQQITYKYLKEFFWILTSQLLQNLKKITLLINKKKSKEIAFYIENFFAKEKGIHPSLKLQKRLPFYEYENL